MIEQSDEFELYLSEVENVSSLEELKNQLDCNEIDYGERYIGTHSLYYKIWSQRTLIDALETMLSNSQQYKELAENRCKVLDNATLEQIKQINELNKKIDSLKINEMQLNSINDALEYLNAIKSRINVGADTGLSSTPSRTYFNKALAILEQAKFY